jgi:hypothetical protein
MEWEYTKSETLRFKNEEERDNWLDIVYPNRKEDSFDKGTYSIYDNESIKINVLWNMVQVVKEPVIVSMPEHIVANRLNN